MTDGSDREDAPSAVSASHEKLSEMRPGADRAKHVKCGVRFGSCRYEQVCIIHERVDCAAVFTGVGPRIFFVSWQKCRGTFLYEKNAENVVSELCLVLWGK